MNTRYIFASVLTISFLGMLAALATLEPQPSPDPDWTSLAPGIDYRRFTLPDPNRVFVARLDRNNQNAVIDAAVSQGSLGAGIESVSGMVDRASDSITYWGSSQSDPIWGMRAQPVVAINGSYFNDNSGLPQGGQVISGWYAKRFADLSGWSGFAWTLDRQAFIGDCVAHPAERQSIAFPFTGGVLTIDEINQPPGADALVLFTPQFGPRTPAAADGLEVVVQMTRPALIIPQPAYVTGLVLEVRTDPGNTPLYFDQVVLSARGSAAQALAAHAQPGSEINISQEITAYEPDCQTPAEVSWTKTYASVQGAYPFLANGVIRTYSDPGAINRYPRTAIALNNQYVFFIVVDGRDDFGSLGMTIAELATFTRDALGATWGVAQDGGGSSTMVVHGQVVNNTHCNNFPCDDKIVTQGDDEGLVPLAPKGRSPNSNLPPIERYERRVANGLMMVVLHPPVYSFSFQPAASVVTIQALTLYTGPGDNFPALASIPAGTTGAIVPHSNNLNGIYARGEYWWLIDFGGQYGWAAESAISFSGQLYLLQPGSFWPGLGD